MSIKILFVLMLTTSIILGCTHSSYDKSTPNTDKIVSGGCSAPLSAEKTPCILDKDGFCTFQEGA